MKQAITIITTVMALDLINLAYPNNTLIKVATLIVASYYLVKVAKKHII